MRLGPIIIRNSNEKKNLKAFKKKIELLEEEYGFSLGSSDPYMQIEIFRQLDDGSIESINSNEAVL